MKTKRKRYRELAPEPFDSELSAVNGLKKKVFRYPLSHEDALQARFDTKGGRMIQFAVQYECLIEGRWHPIIRIDATPLERPHQHVYVPGGRKERKEVLVGQSRKYGEVFHEAMRHLTGRFEDYKGNYKSAYEQS